MMTAHGDALRRVARRYSASADDADDAVQRGLEIYLRRLARVDPATEVAWLKVVIKHEALAVGRCATRTSSSTPIPPTSARPTSCSPAASARAGSARRSAG